MKRKKAIISISIVAVVSLIIGFVVLTIINSKDCSQFVIDTYELHSGIDIPKVKYINCYYDERKEIRISIYQLATNVNQYINQHNFELIQFRSDSDFKGFGMLNPNELPENKELYVAKGEKWGHKWQYVIEKETKRIWLELSYR